MNIVNKIEYKNNFWKNKTLSNNFYSKPLIKSDLEESLYYIRMLEWRNQGRHCCRRVLCRTSTLLRGQSDVTVIPERVTSTAVVRPTNVTLTLIE